MNMFDLDALFRNVGVKIQTVAKVSYFVCLAFILLGGVIGVIAALFSGSFLLILLSLVMVVVLANLYFWSALISSWYIHGFGLLVEKAEKDLGYVETESDYKPMYGDAAQKLSAQHRAPATAPADGWKCTCGKTNPKYVSTCSCGKSAREVREQKNTQRSNCPRCGKEVCISAGAKSGYCEDCEIAFAIE